MKIQAGYFEGVPRPGPTRVKDHLVLFASGFGGTNRVTGRALFKGSGSVRPGKWKFQFDTSARYKASASQKVVLRLKVTRGGIVKPGEQTKLGKN